MTSAESKAHDLAFRRRDLDRTDRLALGRWHWMRAGYYGAGQEPSPADLRRQDGLDRRSGTVTRYVPAKVLDVFRGHVLVGVRGNSRAEWVEAWRVTTPLSGPEQSTHLRTEPARRDYEPPDLVPRGHTELRAQA